MDLNLSAAEKAYLAEGIAANIRSDGRGRTDYRHFELEVGVVSNTNGSARVQLSGTDVLVGVKMEVGEPEAAAPDSGRIEFEVECSAAASPAFEARGGEGLALDIAQTLRRICSHTSAFPRKDLCIIPGQTVWIMRVDTLVLECSGGSLYDCVVLAVKAALQSTKIPVVEVVGNGVDEPLDFEISDDPFAVRQISMTGFPVLVTLALIGRYHVVDATAEEEACAAGFVRVAVNAAGNLCSIVKGGTGGVAPAALLALLELGQKTGVELDRALMQALAIEAKAAGATASRGFLS